MRTSKRLGALKLLTELVGGVTPDNGYDFNLLGCVFRGRVEFGADAPQDYVAILEDVRPDFAGRTVGENREMQQSDWVILLKGETIAEDDHPADRAHEMLAAVQHRLSLINAETPGRQPLDKKFHRLGGTIASATIHPGTAGVPREGSAGRAVFFLPIVLRTTFSAAEPFVKTTP